MSKRINVLMGAGAVIDFTGVSTQSITQSLFVNNMGADNEDLFTILGGIRDTLNFCCNKEVTFEDMHHLLMVLLSYKQKSVESYPIEQFIFSIKDNIPSDLHSLTFENLSKVQTIIIKKIYDIVGEYSKEAPTAEFKIFFKRITDGVENTRLDIYNLNYDTWVEQSLTAYMDGFERRGGNDFHLFNRKRAISPLENEHMINHIHGCVNFNHSSGGYTTYSMVKYDYPIENYSGVCDYVTLQSGNLRCESPIITDLSKTEFMIAEPYRTYYSNMVRSFNENNPIIIIGYGFGDYYINDLLSNYHKAHENGKQVIIISPGIEPLAHFDWFINYEREELIHVIPRINSNSKIIHTEDKSVLWYRGKFKEACNDEVFMKMVLDVIRKTI